MQNKELFSAMLADAQYWHDVFLNCGTDKSLSTVSFYQTQALSLLRQKIDNLQSRGDTLPSDATIVAVVLLTGTDVRNSDYCYFLGVLWLIGCRLMRETRPPIFMQTPCGTW